MKKTLLTLSALVLSIGAFAQMSPFWNIPQNSNFPDPSSGMIQLDVVDANTVWGIGNFGANGRYTNHFTRTTNGGTLWAAGDVFPDTNTYVISNIDALTSNIAWVAAYKNLNSDSGAIFKTLNGGINWTLEGNTTMFNNKYSFANWIQFPSASIGVCMGDPNPSTGNEFEIWRSTDAGATWSLVPGSVISNTLSGEYGLTNSCFTLGNTIWFGTNKGRVVKSLDAGATWTTVSAVMGGVSEVSDIAFTDQNNGLCFGRNTTTTNLWKTSDGGLTWTILGQPINCGFNSVVPLTGSNVFVSCSNNSMTIAWSANNGSTWNSFGGTGIPYLTIGFANNLTGWAGSFSNSVTATVGGVYKYNQTQPLTVGQSNFAPTAISAYPNPSNGLVYVTLPSAKHGMDLIVTDALGNVVYTEKMYTTTSDQGVLNLQHLAKGVYQLNITTPTEKLFQKIVIE